MDIPKPTVSGPGPADLAQAMGTLAATIREAGECLLDLQHAVERLNIANNPQLSQAIDRATADCIRAARRR